MNEWEQFYSQYFGAQNLENNQDKIIKIDSTFEIENKQKNRRISDDLDPSAEKKRESFDEGISNARNIARFGSVNFLGFPNKPLPGANKGLLHPINSCLSLSDDESATLQIKSASNKMDKNSSAVAVVNQNE